MWVIIKFDKKKLNIFSNEVKKKIGNNIEIYLPKIKIERFKKNRLVKKDYNLLGDYLFCFNRKFSENFFLKQLNYIRGVKYFLEGFKNSQDEINYFITKCKEYENKDGYILDPIYKLETEKYYKFSSGPFTQKIFKILSIQKEKIKILIGNSRTVIKKKNYSIIPV